MAIKFFGAVSGSSGSLMRGVAHSTNFTVSKQGDHGTYTITLDQWIAQQPVVQATPLSALYNQGEVQQIALVSGMKQLSDDNPAWQFTVTTYDRGTLADVDFSFTVIAGSHFVVTPREGTTFALKPQLQRFGARERTILKTVVEVTPAEGPMTSYEVDGPTRFIVVSEDPVTVTLDDEIQGYTVEAFNYHPGSCSGTPWYNGGATLNPPNRGVLTVPYQIIVTATDADGGILWSDPVIRLSKAPPDGLVPIPLKSSRAECRG